jgi:hypothetical protein
MVWRKRMKKKCRGPRKNCEKAGRRNCERNGFAGFIYLSSVFAEIDVFLSHRLQMQLQTENIKIFSKAFWHCVSTACQNNMLPFNKFDFFLVLKDWFQHFFLFLKNFHKISILMLLLLLYL